MASLDVPAYIAEAADRGLVLRADGYGGDGLTEKTIREARDMAAGTTTEDKVVRANAWAARHAVDLDATKNSDSGDDDWPGAGAVAHYLWGIDPLDPEPARAWFATKAETIQAGRSVMDDQRAIDENVYELSLVQKAVYQSLEDVVEVFGKFSPDASSDGAHYVPVSPLAAEGHVCSSCLFYEGARACEIVEGDIAPEGICRYHQIPEALIDNGSEDAAKHDDDEEDPVVGGYGKPMSKREEPFMMQRENLSRIVEFRAAPSEDGLTLSGYAAVFNEWTNIDSYEGTFREQIAPGAFKRTIGQRMPILQFDHGSHPLIGSIPLGRITSISEDARGLKIKARLSDNWLVEPVRDAIRDGAITGMSFRFSVPANGETVKKGDDGMYERTITEVALYEVGPVVFPAYEQTSVGVRSRQALDALQDPEVRSELARILTTGTDFESPAVNSDPAISHSESSDLDSASGHSEVVPRTRAQREALVALSLERHP